MKTNKRNVRLSSLAGALAGCLLVSAWQSPAQAYTSRVHQRMPDQAYQLLNQLRRGSHLPDVVARSSGGSAPAPLTARPPSVPADQAASWAAFVAEAIAAPGRLDQMVTDLPDPKRDTDECGDFYPAIPRDNNQLASCRAAELPFAMDGGWGRDDSRCYLRRGYNFGDADAPEMFQDVPNSLTGALLGYWAQHPDDLWDDTHMDIRPTNILFLGAIRSFVEDAFEYGAVILIAPFVCIGDLLLGDGDCLDDARNIAHQADPIVDFELPPIPGTDKDGNGFGSFTTTGMWHFVSPGRSGDFNRIPGLQISTGGLPAMIDKWDAVAMALGDVSGYTVNPDNSDGVAHYSPYADGPLTRRRGDWTGISFPHVEFEPLDNLAQYGWKHFCDDGATGRHSKYLGWPLHAIGDAVQPHHVISTLGWGHRPWESFSGLVWPEIFEQAGDAQHYRDLQTILGYAWNWWTMLKSSNDDVKKMIEKLASDTLASPGAFFGAIFQPLDQNYDPGELRGFYSGQTANLKDLMMRAMGASVAFLARASTRIDGATTTQTACACPTNQARRGLDRAGKMLHSPTCAACGQDPFAAAPYWLDDGCVAYCPEDKPFVVNGACSATCAGAGCSTATCPADRHFTENGACVAACSAANHLVVDNSKCSGACPAGQTPDGLGYCINIVPPGPVCAMSMPGQSGPQGQGDTSCCVGRGNACKQDNDCCSMMCGPDGLCLGQTGDRCVTPADCITKSCVGAGSGQVQAGICAPDSGGHGRCASNADCASGVCHADSDHVSAGYCAVPIGVSCGVTSDCVAGICFGHFANVCCLPGATACTKGADCCSGFCSSGKCTATPIYVD